MSDCKDYQYEPEYNEDELSTTSMKILHTVMKMTENMIKIGALVNTVKSCQVGENAHVGWSGEDSL